MYHHTISRTIMFWAIALFLPELLFAGSYSGGSGTVGDPYQIADLDDLSELCQTSADWASGKYFKQTADINASATQYWDDVDDESSPDGNLYNDPNDGTSAGNDEGFSPIGNSSTKFFGVYDGNGHTISGLKINRGSTNYVGFFGFAIGGFDISNLGVEGGSVSGASYTGGFGGVIIGGTLTNCYSTAAVVGTSNVGGFLGSGGNLSECYSTGTVTGTSDNVGGLIGYCEDDIFRCYSTGDAVSLGGYYAGGLIGYKFQGDIRDSYSWGGADDISDDDIYRGGFIGYNRGVGTTENCYSTGSSNYGGGFIGTNNAGVCTDCFWDKDASGNNSAVFAGIESGITGKTTSQMKTLSTFTAAGWDFENETTNGTDNYWDLSGSYNSGYPFLSWQDDIDESLPVTLSEWSGSSSSKGIILQWSTESEIENLGFIIERKSASRSTWREIAHFKTHTDLEGQGSVNHRTDYQYTDQWVQDGFSYDYRLSDVDYHGKVNYHPAITVTMKGAFSSVRPDHFGLIDAFPNPCNPQTTIQYNLPEETVASLLIYDISGNEISTLVNQQNVAGFNTVVWNGMNDFGQPVASGVYVIQLQAKGFNQSKKIVLLK